MPPHSLMGVTKAKGKTALFQEGFAISGKEFRSRQSVGGWAGVAGLRFRTSHPCVASFGIMTEHRSHRLAPFAFWFSRHADKLG
jgi:hypothetical protein